MEKITNESLGATHTGSLKENKKKNIKGITLVALVVTIVILLILAGISIQAITQTNLFDKAKEAKQVTLNSMNEENKMLNNYNKKIEGVVGETTRENNQSSSYRETILFDGNVDSGSITFKDNHNIDEFNSLKFLYGEFNTICGIIETELTISSYKYVMDNGDKTVDFLVGLYGYANQYININNLTKTGFTIRDNRNQKLYRVYGINY